MGTLPFKGSRDCIEHLAFQLCNPHSENEPLFPAALKVSGK